MSQTTTSPAKSPARSKSGLQQTVWAFASLVALVIGFSFLAPNFFQTGNLLAILQAAVVPGVLAVGVTLIIITGGIDLSIGTMMTFCAVLCGVVLTWMGAPLLIGVLAAIVTGALCGLFSGILVTQAKIPPFIATLGLMLILKGMSLIITGAKPIYFNDTPGFTDISGGSLIGKLIPALPVPNGVLILFVVAAVTAWILNRTVLGRYCFALGSNEEAVRLSGVNTDNWKMAIYALAGSICGIAGLLIASRQNSAQPAQGLGYELDAIAAVVIGGTSLAGGRGTVLGTVIGALIMAVLTNGLRVMKVQPEWQTVATGAIIIMAVYADQLRRKAR